MLKVVLVQTRIGETVKVRVVIQVGLQGMLAQLDGRNKLGPSPVVCRFALLQRSMESYTACLLRRRLIITLDRVMECDFSDVQCERYYSGSCTVQFCFAGYSDQYIVLNVNKKTSYRIGTRSWRSILYSILYTLTEL